MEEKFLYQNSTFKDRRKDLRNYATEVERLLWEKLRKSQLGYKFTRQYSAGPYIVDFYCPKLRFAIELDGDVHNSSEARMYDKERDKYLQGLDIVTIRFWNNEIVKGLEKVINVILKSLKQRSEALSS